MGMPQLSNTHTMDERITYQQYIPYKHLMDHVGKKFFEQFIPL